MFENQEKLARIQFRIFSKNRKNFSP